MKTLFKRTVLALSLMLSASAMAKSERLLICQDIPLNGVAQIQVHVLRAQPVNCNLQETHKQRLICTAAQPVSGLYLAVMVIRPDGSGTVVDAQNIMKTNSQVRTVPYSQFIQRLDRLTGDPDFDKKLDGHDLGYLFNFETFGADSKKFPVRNLKGKVVMTIYHSRGVWNYQVAGRKPQRGNCQFGI
jgi:hypothetical protein